jgi:integrase
VQATWAIEAYLKALTRRGASPATIRQRRWALDQAVTAAALERLAGPAPSAAAVAAIGLPRLARATSEVTLVELLDPVFVARYTAWSATGALSGTGAGRSQASTRARVAALRALAGHHQRPEPAQSAPPPDLREHLAPSLTRYAIDALTSRGFEHHNTDDIGVGTGDERARLAAMLVVVELCPLRSAQMCALRRGAVRADGALLTPPTPPGQDDTADDLQVPARWRPVLEHWLGRRDRLVAALEGTTEALWVSVRPNHDPRTRATLPPGLPLHPRGLQRSYAKAVALANVEHLGTPGFPLPRSFDLLRRSVAARHGAAAEAQDGTGWGG